MSLALNVKKTECMVISKKSSNPECNLVSKGKQIKQVTKFKYLGYLITSDGSCTSEVSKRIAMAKNETNTGSISIPIRVAALSNLDKQGTNELFFTTLAGYGGKDEAAAEREADKAMRPSSHQIGPSIADFHSNPRQKSLGGSQGEFLETEPSTPCLPPNRPLFLDISSL
ncbi:craniofacial development protein 2 [Plakobranchus ocellatus]|uniref:Craniofacial development protein 2 n=1 Tax=Plakobranchus ocellatus TaxID=259542 RepID=A0AAV3ZHS4_9GAST|nr:craniofacial development protein 2 [Plakobranchus ocellatus]